jgi:hypothetical protein
VVLTLSQGKSVINFGPTLLWSAKMLSRCLLFKPVFIVQAAQDWMDHHTQMLRKPVPIRLQRRGQWWRRLRNAWPQGHVGTAVVVMLYPRLEEALQMMSFRQRNHAVQTFPPQRAQGPLAVGIGLRTPHWSLEHSQPQLAL